jgi:hypothetical protein
MKTIRFYLRWLAALLFTAALFSPSAAHAQVGVCKAGTRCTPSWVKTLGADPATTTNRIALSLTNGNVCWDDGAGAATSMGLLKAGNQFTLYQGSNSCASLSTAVFTYFPNTLTFQSVRLDHQRHRYAAVAFGWRHRCAAVSQ